MTEFTHNTNLLTKCTPDPTIVTLERQRELMNRPNREDPFIASKHNLRVGCIERIRTEGGEYRGSSFLPVIERLQAACPEPVREFVFHGAITASHYPFVLVQKLGNSRWNTSMAAAVEKARTTPITLRADHSLGCYVFEESDIAIKADFTKEQFDQLIGEAFHGLIIDRLDHPLLMIERQGGAFDV